MIKYQLVKSAITTEKDICHAIVSCNGTMNLDKILQEMISEGSGLTKPQALAYFEKLTQVIMYYTAEGFSINTPLFRIRPAISGKFDGKADLYDPQRHELHFCMTPGIRLSKHSAKLKVRKVQQTSMAPQPVVIEDSQKDIQNLTLNSGTVGILYGKRLNFDKKDTRQGVFFTPADNPGTEFRAIVYSLIQPSQLHFLMPELVPGEYKIVVKKLSESGLKLLSGQLTETVKVVAS